MKNIVRRRARHWCAAVLAMAGMWGCTHQQPTPPVPTAEHPSPYPGMANARAKGGTLVLPRGGSGASDSGK
ncbi:MAG: hypothetical protein ACP5VE_11235 [Chthonomonadales bacterium]